jgi:beta-phosphoglucomutase family hydrolase
VEGVSSLIGPTGAAVRFLAMIFDLDGVVTDTARLHAAAWKQLFDEFLAAGAGPGGQFEPFDVEADYRRYVDGRAREVGVAAFLASRGIHLPAGGPSDLPEAGTVWALAARKNRIFLELVAARGVRAFPAAVDLLGRLRTMGVATAVVPASRNAPQVLDAAGLTELFDVRIDGNDALALGLAGKPDPATFVEAARRLGVDPGAAAVVEDAAAGVVAARRGGFGLVVGLDRGDGRARLFAAGADVVVDDLGQLDLGAIRTDPWVLVYEGFDPAHEGHREALMTLGNGYLATRGAAPETRDDGVHYPGTYLAGVYNRLTTEVGGRKGEDERLVNAPNWLSLDVRIGDGGWWSSGGLRALRDRRELDLRRGLLTRTLLLEEADGRRLRVTQRRLVSMADPHIVALETTLVADGWSGSVSVRSDIDGTVTNNNVAEYAPLAKCHWVPVAAGEVTADTALVEVETSSSHIRVAVAARTAVTVAPATRRLEAGDARAAHMLEVPLVDGVAVVVDKVAAYATSRDRASASPGLAAIAQLERSGVLAALLPAHELAWRHLWGRFAVTLSADTEASLAVNLGIFHILQTLSPHTAELDAGVPARGLHGEGYRGHIFWDELFVFPLLTMRLPALTRALLAYRWRRLDEARAAARRAGLAGAMFPWQSGTDGREETPDELFNLRTRRWMPDNSHLQRHVGLAVAYNAWTYYQSSGDIEFLADRGAGLIVEVARLFASLATHDPDTDRFDIAGIMGPDEYHDAYPGAPQPGLRNNAYTNALTAWVCWRALDAMKLLAGHHCGELWERLALRPEELERFDRLSRRLRICFHHGVISQFQGYEQLAEFDWDRYGATYGNIGRLDLILNAEGDSTNRYKLAKQADVLMLLYLLDADELAALFDRLGYSLTDDVLTRTVEYYLARTACGSTLSRVVHAWALARADRARCR